jgi:CRP-like cAMP-binding protein
LAQLAPSAQRNRLLAHLAPGDRAAIEGDLTLVELQRNAKLEFPNRRIDHVYFPVSGIVSVVAVQEKTTVEVGIISCEGVTAMPVINGDDRSPYSTFMQVAGEGYRAPADKFRELLDRPAARRVFSRWIQAFMIQTSQTAVANARATIEERLARWLLMAHDRVAADKLPLTHEFLSLMMGAGRPGVTEAVHSHVKRGLIRTERGLITVLDREGLIELAGEYYGVPEREYERLLPGETPALSAVT